MQTRVPRGAHALFGALGGSGDAYDREMDRLSKMELSQSQVGFNNARADAERREIALKEAMDGRVKERGSDDTMIRALMLRDPTIPPDAARAHVRRASGGPFAAPQYASPEQQRLAGETLVGMIGSSLADKPTDGADLAEAMFKAGSSAQRLRAPELAATDPITAAFMNNAGTGKDAPTLFNSLPSGLGTFGAFTGQMNINQPLQQSVVAENNAQANHANASAGAASALAAQRRAETGFVGQQVDATRGIVIDKRTGQARPITADGKPIGERQSGGVNVNVGGRPLPAAALRLQQDELEAIGLASGIDADLAAIDKQIEGGALDLGPVGNIVSRGRNMVGMSNENSRNFQSFQSMLEKMRNDSLRLNKGVQTEGDAQRAWNELIANTNDPQAVRQRLAEIRAINQRAVEHRRFNVDVIRNNYGAGPLDVSPITKPTAAVGTRPQRIEANGVVGAELPQVMSAQDYEALPSGAMFLDPEGNERRKP